MLTEPRASQSVHAQCIIERYKRELKYNIAPVFYLNNLRLHEKIKLYYCFPSLFSALFYDPTPEQIRYIGQQADIIVSRRNAFLVERVMQRACAKTGNADIALWQKSYQAEPWSYGYRALLICGSAHPDGFFRQQCLEHFAEEHLFRMLDCILVRLNDWVPEVRKTAHRMLEAMMQAPDASKQFIEAMPFVAYLRRSGRAEREEEFSMEKLDTVLMRYFEETPKLVSDSPAPIRKLCYQVFALYPEQDHRGLMLHFFRNEPDGELRCMLERIYLKMSKTPVSAPALQQFTEDRYEHTRLIAYEYRYQQEGLWDGFEQLLLSESRRIRIFAKNRLKDGGRDYLSFCRNHLPETLQALGDFGTAEDIPKIRPYQESHPCHALYALVRLGAEERGELVFRCMHSADRALAKYAYRLARTVSCFTVPELLADIRHENDRLVQKRLAALMTKGSFQDALPDLIRILRDYPHLKNDILGKIRKYTAHTYYVTSAQGKNISDALAYAREGNHIPYDVNNQIFFSMKHKRIPASNHTEVT